MRRIMVLLTLSFFGFLISTTEAAEIKLPFDGAKLASQVKRRSPAFVKVSGAQNLLKIAIAKHNGRAGYVGKFSIPVKAASGRSVTLSFNFKLENVVFFEGAASNSVGRIIFANREYVLPGTAGDWQSCTIQNVKIPDNGQLKMEVALRGVSSANISLRSPKMKYDLSKRDNKNKNKNKKKKKKSR